MFLVEWFLDNLTVWVLPKAGILVLMLNRRTNVEPCANAQSKPFSPAFGNTLLAAGLNFAKIAYFLR